MKKKILTAFFAVSLILFFSPAKSFSQDVWTWDDSLHCQNNEGVDLLLYFSNGKISNEGSALSPL